MSLIVTPVRRCVAIALLTACSLIASATVSLNGAICRAEPLVGLMVFGDSLSDEYFEQSYGSYSRNWVPLLVDERGVNVGPQGSWGEPRRHGYQHNWARASANSSHLVAGLSLFSGQWQSPIIWGQVSHGVLAIGANDFHPTSTAYQSIYDGTWSQTQINDYVASVRDNIDTVVSAIRGTGLPLVLANVLDYGATPSVRNSYPSATGREAVAAAIMQLNAEIDLLAQQYELPLADLSGLARDIFGTHTAMNSSIEIGGVNINLLTGGTSATNAFVADGVHPHTVLQGVIANLFLTALRRGYGVEVELFTEEELLTNANLAYGGVDTLSFDVNDYVLNYVPEPATIGIFALGAAMALIARRRCVRPAGVVRQ